MKTKNFLARMRETDPDVGRGGIFRRRLFREAGRFFPLKFYYIPIDQGGKDRFSAR
jgi:hypothetical protein